MFIHPDVCPWAKRPLMLPVACFLTALGGFIFWKFLGVTPLTAAICMGWGIIVLRDGRSARAACIRGCAAAIGDDKSDADLSFCGGPRHSAAHRMVFSVRMDARRFRPERRIDNIDDVAAPVIGYQ